VTLLLTLLIMVVIGLVAAVAAGRIGGGLDDPASSLPGRGLPPGPFSLEDVDRVRFSPALRGYRMDEVDDVIDRLVDELRRLEEEVAELRGRGAPEHPSANGRYLPGDGWTDRYGDFRRPAPTASSPPTSNDDDGIGDR
jgi:DivIVA domain-containing protein